MEQSLDTATAFAQRAIDRLEISDVEGALADIESAFHLDPNCARAFTARGYYFSHNRDRDRALVDLDRATELDPMEAAAYDVKGHIYKARQEHEKALAEHVKAASCDPKDPVYPCHAGDNLLSLGRVSEAMEAYDRAVELGRGRAYIHTRRAMALAWIGNFAAAIADYDTILASAPNDPSTLARRGSCYVDLQDYARAIADLDAALPRLPANLWNGELFLLRGRSHYQLANYAQALSDLEQALAQGNTEFGVHMWTGFCWERLGDRRRAIDGFTRAIDVDPSITVLCQHRGKLYLELEEFDSALADATMALAAEPTAKSYILRARARLRGGSAATFSPEQFALQCSDLEAAIRLEPKNSEAMFLRARAADERQLWSDAIEYFDQAVRLAPSDFFHRLHRSLVLMRLGQYEEALDDLDEAQAMNDIQRRHHRHAQALVLSNAGAYEEALAAWDDVSREASLPANSLLCRAMAFKGLGYLDQALADLNEAQRLAPDQPIPYYLRNQVWQELDELDKAVEDLNMAIRLNPDSSMYHRERANVWTWLNQDARADADDARAEEIELRQFQSQSELLQDDSGMIDNKHMIYELVKEHFSSATLDQVAVTERSFPFRAGAELQMAFESLSGNALEAKHFCAVQLAGGVVTNITSLWSKDRRNPVLPGPPHYQEIDIGEDKPVRCLQDGLWLLRQDDTNFAVLLETHTGRGIHLQVAALAGTAGERATGAFFRHLEDTVRKGACYRGKVLSLEMREMYSGQAQGIMVHRLRNVERDEVILPARVLDLIDRNTVQFVQRRPFLAELGMSTKKGLLFYGPPGMGKTHTIHYLTRALPGHTTFLVTAEQVGILSEYLTLAHLFRPSVVVIEDVDLIARHRSELRSAIEESLLNRLLNEMDGLRPDADILFILTTNRPEMLEEALSSRPGRIDQAVEFPLPDADGRAKLIKLYGRGLNIPDDVIRAIVQRTDRVSAAFIKELMRRLAQYHFETQPSGLINLAIVDQALNELLVEGGSLNRKLLGAGLNDGNFGFQK